MMGRFRVIPLLLTLILGLQEGIASHIGGAEITYKHVIDQTYRFKLKVYRDCRDCKFNGSGGGDNSSNCNEVPDLIIRGALGTTYSSNQLGVVEIERQSITDLTQACGSAVSKCRPGSDMSHGFEVHEFEGVFDFSTLLAGSYCKFDISISMSSRNSAINTMMTEQNFFNYAMLNLCEARPNHSTEFTASPTFVYYLNQSAFVSPGTVNSDGDSLAFSLKPALVGRSVGVAYASGRSSDLPFTSFCPPPGGNCPPNLTGALVEGFYCSKETGDHAFTPVQPGQGGVILVECEEWKKKNNGQYYLAGVVRRDVYAEVINPLNNLPVLKNKDLSWTVCEGTQTSTELLFEDVPMSGFPTDTVFAEIEAGTAPVYLEKIPIGSAPFYKYRLHINPARGQHGEFRILLKAADSHCPLRGTMSRTISVKVLQSREIAVAFQTRNCGLFEASSLYSGAQNFFWTLKDAQSRVIRQQASKRLSTQLPGGGIYILECMLPAEPGYCEAFYSDTITIAPFTKPVLQMGPDRQVCSGTALSLQPELLQTYAPHHVFADARELNGFPYLLQANQAVSIRFRVVQDDGCFAEDQVSISTFPRPAYTVKNDTLCVNDVFPKKVENIQAAAGELSNIALSYQSDGSALLRSGPLHWDLSVFSYTAHRMQVFSRVLDQHQCAYTDTSWIEMLEPEPVEVKAPARICVNAVPLPLETRAGGQWECVSHPALVKNNTLYSNGRNYNTLILKYNQNLQCYNAATFPVQMTDTVPIVFAHAARFELCENSGDFRLLGQPAGGLWSGAHLNGDLFRTSLATGETSSLLYTFTSPNGCTSRSSAEISVLGLPELSIEADKSLICVGDILSLQALSDQSSPGYWYTEGEGSFEMPASRQTLYRPSQNDVNKGPLRFTYTLQTGNVCGNVPATLWVRVKNGPEGSILPQYPSEICEPASLTFRTDFSQADKQYWFINDSLVETFDYPFDLAAVLPAGEYVIKTKVYDSTCEAIAISEPIQVLPRPQARMLSNPVHKISREYPRIYLKDISVCRNGHTTQWYFNRTAVGQEREFYYRADDSRDSFTMSLVAVSLKGGCRDSVSQLFVYIPVHQLYIPDAFSPDAKGPDENNVFRVQGPSMKSYSIEIFNRFGEKVFVSDNMAQVWDGTYRQEDCMQGVYFYKISTSDWEGVSRDYSGTITLIR